MQNNSVLSLDWQAMCTNRGMLCDRRTCWWRNFWNGDYTEKDEMILIEHFPFDMCPTQWPKDSEVRMLLNIHGDDLKNRLVKTLVSQTLDDIDSIPHPFIATNRVGSFVRHGMLKHCHRFIRACISGVDKENGPSVATVYIGICSQTFIIFISNEQGIFYPTNHFLTYHGLRRMGYNFNSKYGDARLKNTVLVCWNVQDDIIDEVFSYIISVDPISAPSKMFVAEETLDKQLTVLRFPIFTFESDFCQKISKIRNLYVHILRYISINVIDLYSLFKACVFAINVSECDQLMPDCYIFKSIHGSTKSYIPKNDYEHANSCFNFYANGESKYEIFCNPDVLDYS